jgi:RNA polymerase sigma-70 factor (ECF subfamily)
VTSVATSSTAARPAELDDLTLARAQRGEAAACKALVERYQRPVFALVGRVLGPRARRELIEDLAQETFLKAFRALPAYQRGGAARLSTWLLTIATRLAIDELRRAAPPLVPLDEALGMAATGERADVSLDRRRRALAVAHAVEQLSGDHRAVLVLREAHDFDYPEIAAALDLDVGTVKSRLSRARAALRTALTAAGITEDDHA